MKASVLLAPSLALLVCACRPGRAEEKERGEDPRSWSAVQGRLTWEEAGRKCTEIGLELPASQDFRAAEKTDAYASWERGAYWSSSAAPGGEGRALTFLVTDLLGIPSGGLDRGGKSKQERLLVRCIQSAR